MTRHGHPNKRLSQPKGDEGYRQVNIKIELDTPGRFIVNVTSDRGGVRSQVCDSQDEVRQFVAAFL